MKKLFILLIFLSQIVFAQQSNIVPAGDFEFFDPSNQVICGPGTPQPCGVLGSNWCLYQDWFPYDATQTDGDGFWCPWHSFKDQMGGPDNAKYFSDYHENSCIVFESQLLPLKIPFTYWGNIYPIGGTAVGNHAVVGLGKINGEDNVNPHGISVQLTEPLKVNVTYTLEFYAAYVQGSNLPEIKVAIGPDDKWNHRIKTKKIKIDNKLSGTNWKQYTWSFSLDENDPQENKCDIQWLFIKTTGGEENTVIDNVKISNDVCTDACSSTHGVPVINCNNVHATNHPLTFSGLQSVGNFTLSISTIIGQSVVAYVAKNHYCHDVYSWDGKNQFGSFVADAPYAYELTFENDCYKCKQTGVFIKSEQYLVNGSNTNSYYDFGITANQVNPSTIEFGNLYYINNFIGKVRNSAGVTVRTWGMGNPPTTIAFDGKDDLGNLLPAGTYKFGWEAENQCLHEIFDFSKYFSFTLSGAAPVSPYLNPAPVSKPYFICDKNFQTASADLSDRPCCEHRPSHIVQYPIITDQITYRLIDKITASNSRILPGSQVDMHAGDAIIMQPGTFIAEAGSQFTAEIEPCAQRQPAKFDINEYLEQYNYPTAHYEGEDKEDDEPLATIQEKSNLIKVYPNPANNLLFVDFKETRENYLGLQIALYDAQGKMVDQANVKNQIESLDISSLKSGFYFIKVIGDRVNYSNKVIINDN